MSGRSEEAPAPRLMGSGPGFNTELCSMLACGRFFGDLPAAQVEALAQYVQAYSAAPDTVIFREGDGGSFMCMLFEGGAEIYKQDHHFGSKRIGRVEPGKTVGEMALIDGEPRSATCICDLPSTLIMLSRENFVRIVREQPALSVNILLKLVTLMSRRLRVTSGQLVDYLEGSRN